MNARVLGAALAVVLGLGIGGTASGASDPGWRLTMLPLPAGHEDATGYVTGTDGHGGYSGYLRIGAGTQVVTWSSGRPAVRGTPPGTEFAETRDQNRAGTIIGNAIDHETGAIVPFTLAAPGFRLLARSGFTTAINERGDIVGGIANDVVLWPAGGEPVVVQVDLPSARAIDIDDDGTVLLASETGNYLWREGVLTRLADPSAYAMAIRNGWIVGTGLLWREPNAPTPLRDASIASEINGTGLIVGREQATSVNGPLAVWRGSAPLERLPVPNGWLGTAGALADDGSIAGWVSMGNPSEGGRPAVWLPS